MGGNGRRQEGGVTGESKAVRQGMAQTGGREGGEGVGEEERKGVGE